MKVSFVVMVPSKSKSTSLDVFVCCGGDGLLCAVFVLNFLNFQYPETFCFPYVQLTTFMLGHFVITSDLDNLFSSPDGADTQSVDLIPKAGICSTTYYLLLTA